MLPGADLGLQPLARVMACLRRVPKSFLYPYDFFKTQVVVHIMI
jgi:hypothetical protein